MKHLVGFAFGLGIVVAAYADDVGTELAHLLSSEKTREVGISRAVESPAKAVPLLLSWARTPPKGIDTYQLNLGLADVFAALRTEEAIPFLIANISLKRGGNVDFAPWLKTPEAIEKTFPAVNALIRIGPTASEKVMAAARGAMTPNDRLAAIFVVGRVGGVPGAVPFLRRAQVEANTQATWAGLGLKELDR